MWIRRGCDSPSSGRTSGTDGGLGEEGEQGRAWPQALRSINNPEADLSSIHVRSADPGVCMKNPEGDGLQSIPDVRLAGYSSSVTSSLP